MESVNERKEDGQMHKKRSKRKLKKQNEIYYIFQVLIFYNFEIDSIMHFIVARERRRRNNAILCLKCVSSGVHSITNIYLLENKEKLGRIHRCAIALKILVEEMAHINMMHECYVIVFVLIFYKSKYKFSIAKRTTLANQSKAI